MVGIEVHRSRGPDGPDFDSVEFWRELIPDRERLKARGGFEVRGDVHDEDSIIQSPVHREWRLAVARAVALELGLREEFKVKEVYLFGSINKNLRSKPGLYSDIDIMVIHDGGPAVQNQLELWAEDRNSQLAGIYYGGIGQSPDGQSLLGIEFCSAEEAASLAWWTAKFNPARGNLPLRLWPQNHE